MKSYKLTKGFEKKKQERVKTVKSFNNVRLPCFENLLNDKSDIEQRDKNNRW